MIGLDRPRSSVPANCACGPGRGPAGPRHRRQAGPCRACRRHLLVAAVHARLGGMAPGLPAPLSVGAGLDTRRWAEQEFAGAPLGEGGGGACLAEQPGAWRSRRRRATWRPSREPHARAPSGRDTGRIRRARDNGGDESRGGREAPRSITTGSPRRRAWGRRAAPGGEGQSTRGQGGGAGPGGAGGDTPREKKRGGARRAEGGGGGGFSGRRGRGGGIQPGGTTKTKARGRAGRRARKGEAKQRPGGGSHRVTRDESRRDLRRGLVLWVVLAREKQPPAGVKPRRGRPAETARRRGPGRNASGARGGPRRRAGGRPQGTKGTRMRQRHGDRETGGGGPRGSVRIRDRTIRGKRRRSTDSPQHHPARDWGHQSQQRPPPATSEWYGYQNLNLMCIGYELQNS